MNHIVTDSGARFTSERFIRQSDITVVPYQVTIDGESYRDGIDISPEAVLKAVADRETAVQIQAPTVQTYVDLYTRLLRQGRSVISIHTSRQLTKSWANATAAVNQLAAQAKITVIDSENVCAAQGMLVKVAYDSSQNGTLAEDIERLVRGATDRLFTMYCLDSVHHLTGDDLFRQSHIILGDMLGIKPFVTLEEGKLKIVEKVKTFAQAVERLVEFAIEFEDIEESAIIRNKALTLDAARMLKDRYVTEFARQPFPEVNCGSVLACLVGADILGVAILEKEWDVQY